ncbi:MAG: hypothetical protein ACJZ89_01755 [Paracoccaceae bacterium]
MLATTAQGTDWNLIYSSQCNVKNVSGAEAIKRIDTIQEYEGCRDFIFEENSSDNNKQLKALTKVVGRSDEWIFLNSEIIHVFGTSDGLNEMKTFLVSYDNALIFSCHLFSMNGSLACYRISSTRVPELGDVILPNSAAYYERRNRKNEK